MLTRAISLVAVATLVSLLGGGRKDAPVVHPYPRGITVHEWGTFTTVAGVDGRAVDWLPLAGPTDLPCFVEHFRDSRVAKLVPNANGPVDYATVRRRLVSRVRMETPVLYFYAPWDTVASVRVRFPHGLMTEWYPPATVDEGAAMSRPLRDARQEGGIEWPRVRIAPQAPRTFAQGAGESHYYAARNTDAAPLMVGKESEGFLFYRGIGDFDAPVVAISQSDGAIKVENTTGRPIATVVAFTRRDGVMGFRLQRDLRARAVIPAPSLNGTMSGLRSELEAMLVDAGLYPREAAAMLNTWRDSWFEDGTRLFYVLPRALVDSLLPLDVRPAPVELSRVFVGRIEVITSAIEATVQRALDANDLATLDAYGRFLGPITDRILARTSNQAVRARIHSVTEAAFATYLRRASSCE